MKKFTLIFAIFLASQMLCAKDSFRLGFNTIDIQDKMVPAISLKVKSSQTLNFMIEYANSYFAKKNSLAPIDKVQNFNIALNYHF